MTENNPIPAYAPPIEEAPQPLAHADLCDAFLSLDNQLDVANFLTDLCTPSELSAMSERWQIAQMLAKGDKSYRVIAREIGASTTTVARVARFLRDEKNGGYRQALARHSAAPDTPTREEIPTNP
jgi:TrpR-related protein YerC/YecD